MITIDAAKALGWDDEIGSLEPGKKADIITVDLQVPHLTPKIMSIEKWMFLGSGHDVDNVMINGKFCMRNREIVQVNEAKFLDEAEKEALETIKRAGMQKHMEPCDTFWGSTRIYNYTKRF